MQKLIDKIRAKHPHKNWILQVRKGKQRANDYSDVEAGKAIIETPRGYVHLGDADVIVCTIEEGKRDVTCEVNSIYSFTVRI